MSTKKIKTCFCCGEKIKGKQWNSLYCKGCAEVRCEIAEVVQYIIGKRRLRQIFDDYDFRIDVKLIKKRKKYEK